MKFMYSRGVSSAQPVYSVPDFSQEQAEDQLWDITYLLDAC